MIGTKGNKVHKIILNNNHASLSDIATVPNKIVNVRINAPTALEKVLSKNA